MHTQMHIHTQVHRHTHTSEGLPGRHELHQVLIEDLVGFYHSSGLGRRGERGGLGGGGHILGECRGPHLPLTVGALEQLAMSKREHTKQVKQFYTDTHQKQGIHFQ